MSTLAQEQIEEGFRVLRLETEEERAAFCFEQIQLTVPVLEISHTTNTPRLIEE